MIYGIIFNLDDATTSAYFRNKKVTEENISGCTIRELINERGSQKLKKMLEEKS